MPCRLTAAAICFALSCASPVAASVTLFDSSGLYSDTIGTAGLYRITVAGARGGAQIDGVDDEVLVPGGIGALVSGEISLGAGTAFDIVVGGNGGDATTTGFAPGGGGLSLFRAGSILAVAGGGGVRGSDGQAGPDGADGGGTGGGAGGTGGNGGAAGSVLIGTSEVGGGGGAGVLSDGGSSSGSGGQTGPSWAGGSAGGGFGGGGGADLGPGGGGGYSGGGGGGVSGGGGGSFLSSQFTARSLTTGGATDGAFVQLELLKPAVIPLPASIWLLLGGLVGIAALRRRAA